MEELYFANRWAPLRQHLFRIWQAIGLAMDFAFDNSYARLPESFYARVHPTLVSEPRLVKLNVGLAEQLGLNPVALATFEGVQILGGARVPEGAGPIAAAYAGHQFGNFVPQLGDGRAILLGELVGRDGLRRDVQLKGSGRTPFSRGGDGRAALGPVLREYIVSEAMAALGIPTTRALAAVTTGEMVMRETPLPGAVLTRVASSHIRIGTFQFFAARGDEQAVRQLADYAMARHDPDALRDPRPYHAFFKGVVFRQAHLVAQWMLVGFIHGVMNTDNMTISGETIDYGPCAFLDVYDPATVFSSIDRQGRYAYANQPGIAQWNLARLAECLLPLLADDPEEAVTEAKEILGSFAATFNDAYSNGLRKKLGLFSQQDGDLALAQDLLTRMAAGRADYTLVFRGLCEAASDPAGVHGGVRDLFADPGAFDDWASRWRSRLGEDACAPHVRQAAMRRANPAYIPRNHLVEAAIEAAVLRQDFKLFEDLLAVLAYPFDEQPAYAFFARLPPVSSGYRTFCGT